MDLTTISRLSAVLLLATIAGVQCGVGRVTNFTVTNANATAGTTITFTCIVVTSSTGIPTVSFKKSFANLSWHVFSNDESQDSIDNLAGVDQLRYKAGLVPITTAVNTTIIATYNIYNAKNADSGNYTCQTSINSSMSVAVNIFSEATNISMFFNDELIPQANVTTHLPRRYVRLNGLYRLNCTVGGGNPYAQVTLASDMGSIPGPAQYSTVFQRGPGFLDPVSRNATVSVPQWTADVSYIGRPLYCSGGISNPKALSVGFIPVTNHSEPLFSCNDTVYVGKTQADLEITCSVFSHPSNLTSLYIHWHTPDNQMMNMSTPGSVQPGTYSLGYDGHYKLIVTSPAAANDHWWKMTLRVEGVRSRSTNLNGQNFDFVAMNANATAKHVVTAAVEALTTSGAGRAVDVSAAGLFALLVAVFLTARQQQL